MNLKQFLSQKKGGQKISWVPQEKYRNAEYTAPACKFWGGKNFLGWRGKHLFGRGQSILGTILGSILG